jgi:hypothetical protein
MKWSVLDESPVLEGHGGGQAIRDSRAYLGLPAEAFGLRAGYV